MEIYVIISALSGNISTPNFPGMIPEHSQCYHILEADANQVYYHKDRQEHTLFGLNKILARKSPSGISSSIFTKTENRAIKNGELGHHFKTSKGYFGASLEYYVRLLCSVSA